MTHGDTGRILPHMTTNRRRIRQVDNVAIDARTQASGLRSLADHIANAPSESPFHVHTRDELVRLLNERARVAEVRAAALAAKADRLRGESEAS